MIKTVNGNIQASKYNWIIVDRKRKKRHNKKE